MEADFSGYATKAGLKCSDGRTIMPDAFKHQDQMQVPLVWQHGHTDPENVLGHAILENREDGVYAYGFFNGSTKAQHAAGLLEHKDICHMSIWANDLIERSKRVLHGSIREVSLVLSGANPGALIENVTIRHSDGDFDILDDEAIIYTDLELSTTAAHSNEGPEVEAFDENEEAYETEEDYLSDEEAFSHADDSEETIQDVYNSMSEKQKRVLHFMIGEAIAAATEEALANTPTAHSNTTQEGSEMSHNVFENRDKASKPERRVLSHSEVEGIVADATKLGSLKDAVESYALSHGITDIDTLFPDAKSIDGMPEFLQRRTEWVSKVLGNARKSPFSRVKTFSADITVEEARAKGYVKGAVKKEEFFGVAKRVTTPTTIYKKQKLDRDDIVDITDFDVVTWLKSEMRLMLDEELARAVLIGDGRDVASEDKINEQNIRPIAKDHELFTTTVNVNIADQGSSATEIIDAIVENRQYYKGTGLPTMFTTEHYIAQFLLLKDTVGRRIYKSLDELANELRVAEIVPVEVLEESHDVVAVLVNMTDYVLGADNGGNISMFDDFDIDYNKYKYLIETRCSGALTRLKSAIVVKQVKANQTLVVPAPPTFDGTHVTVHDTAGVVYHNAADDSVVNASGGPYAISGGHSMTIYAKPDATHYFATSNDDQWTFTNRA